MSLIIKATAHKREKGLFERLLPPRGDSFDNSIPAPFSFPSYSSPSHRAQFTNINSLLSKNEKQAQYYGK